jgi:hypothetical protein
LVQAGDWPLPQGPWGEVEDMSERRNGETTNKSAAEKMSRKFRFEQITRDIRLLMATRFGAKHSARARATR